MHSETHTAQEERAAEVHEVDEGLFARWWVQVFPRLLMRATWLTGSRDVALDLVQDLAVLALRRLRDPGFPTEVEFQQWAYQRLRWLFLDLQRSRGRRPVLQQLDSDDIGQWAAPRQEGRALVGELSRRVELLPPRQRAVLEEVLLGYSTEEIARKLGIKQATVRSSLRHARSFLAEPLLGSQAGGKRRQP